MKSLAALGLIMGMGLSLPLLSYAQQSYELQAENPMEKSCPLIIKGQRAAMVEDVMFGYHSGGSGYCATIIMTGTDRLEDGDLVLEHGQITEKQLNTDNGKLPEFDMSQATVASMYGTPGKVDHITIKDDTTYEDWYICLYRLPDSMSSPDELREFKKYVIYANGYESESLEIGWQKNDEGYWYNCGNGIYPMNEWKEIDGKSYYFGYNGYMWVNTWTPDGYFVDASGAWVPGYDEELIGDAKVRYEEIFYDENGRFARAERHEVAVSKASEINDLYDNFKENEWPEAERLMILLLYTKSSHER